MFRDLSVISETMWIDDLIEAAKERHGGSLRKLAEAMGIANSTLAQWDSGTNRVAFERLEKLLKLAGGDIHRAMPGHETPGPMQSLEVMGSVQAGSASATFQLDEHHDSLDFLWAKSSGWPLSKGPVKYLRVVGDSMDPIYPESCIIAVRQWNGLELPRSTPAVLYDKLTQSSTLKLYQKRVRAGRVAIFGVPINPAHEAMAWKPSDVEIQFVVIGKAEPLSGREIRQNGNRMVLRDSEESE